MEEECVALAGILPGTFPELNLHVDAAASVGQFRHQIPVGALHPKHRPDTELNNLLPHLLPLSPSPVLLLAAVNHLHKRFVSIAGDANNPLQRYRLRIIMTFYNFSFSRLSCFNCQ